MTKPTGKNAGSNLKNTASNTTTTTASTQNATKSLNILFLEANYPVYQRFKQTQNGHLDYRTKAELLRIAREEIHPNYFIDINCSSCVPKLLTFVYGWFEREHLNMGAV